MTRIARFQPEQSLISSTNNADEKVPVLPKAMMWEQEAGDYLALKRPRFCLPASETSPADAFRPPYAGTDASPSTVLRIFIGSAAEWLSLSEAPDWKLRFEHSRGGRGSTTSISGYFSIWDRARTRPIWPQFSRVTSMASLMLMLDVPRGAF